MQLKRFTRMAASIALALGLSVQAVDAQQGLRGPATAAPTAPAATSAVADPALDQELVEKDVPMTPAETALEHGAVNGQFTFVMFYKTNDAATQAMAKAAKEGLAKYPNTPVAYAQVSDPKEGELVKEFGLERAPVPMLICVAPNGAVTGLYRAAPTAAEVANAFVTPTMMTCMKAMQEGSIVCVCLQTPLRKTTPVAVQNLMAADGFKDRTVSVALDLQDANEARFLQEMAIDAASPAGVSTVVLAPPGVLIGKFGSTATMEEIAAKLHAAGKCCDDPNCKHNHGGAQPQQQQQPVTNDRSATSPGLRATRR